MESSGTPYFPRWTLRRDGVIAPDERLPAGQTVALGIQHVVAMFGATVLAPLLMGFDPNVAILFSGIGTLIFFVAVGGRVPSYLGSSFAFIAVVIAASGYAGSGPNANLGVALGGIVAAGIVYTLIGAGVMAVGYAWIERLMPPPVTGAIVAVIGLNLAPIAVKGVSGSTFDTWIGLATIAAVGVIAVRAGGLARRLPILLGGLAGYVLYAALTNGAGLAQADRLRRGPRRAVVRPAEVHRARLGRAGDAADRARGHRPRRGESGPRQGGRGDDRPESGCVSRPRVPGRRHRHDGRGRGRRHGRHDVRGEHRRDGGHEDLLDAGVRGRRDHRRSCWASRPSSAR